MMSTHKITVQRSGNHPTMGDWEAEYEITFEYRPGAAPIIHPADNADPGYPAEVEFVSISPGASDVGAFTDLAQRDLEDWADNWLQTDGYDEALAIVAADDERGREYAAELRADR
jgi:hypothetical protein